MKHRIGRNYIGGFPPWVFSASAATLTPSMAKRLAPSNPFAAGVLVQGKRDGTGTPDTLTAPVGTVISGGFCPNFDAYQGSIVCAITPEWDGNDNQNHEIFVPISNYAFYKSNSNLLVVYWSGVKATISVATWTAGATYHLVFRWDTKNTIDGTNYTCISINDVHTFGGTAITTAPAASLPMHIGEAGVYPANGIISGLTVYRRPLFDGTYGVDAGNGDEINLIYAAGVGVDPCSITGSWDVCFCAPTNATPGALVTGAGEAWSHCHSSNVLHNWLAADRYFGGGPAVQFNGTTTKIDCGSDAGLDDLADNAFTAEGWFRSDAAPESNSGLLITKSPAGAEGWRLALTTTQLIATVVCATTNATTTYATTTLYNDGKWHHYSMCFNDADGTRKIALRVDGVTVGTQVAGDGAIVADAANSLILGNNTGATATMNGAMGWARVSDVVRYAADFAPARIPPAADGNTLFQVNMSEATGVTVDNVGTIGAAADGTITAGTWIQPWRELGTPVPDCRSVTFNGTTTKIDCGSEASIDNLHDAEFTAECWARNSGANEAGYGDLIDKGASSSHGWFMFIYNNQIIGKVFCVTTSAQRSTQFPTDGKWHHVVMYWNDAGDGNVYMAVDGVWSGASIARNGAVVSEAADNMSVGSNSAGNWTLNGSMAWARISNNDRYNHGVNFTPPPRSNPPANDANTVRLFAMNEGAGTVITDGSTNAQNATLSNGTWNNSRALEVASTGHRIYNWGYEFGVDAANEGIAQAVAVTAGADYYVRAVVASEDGTAQPQLYIYDNTGAALIASIDGTTASRDPKTPNILEIGFEAPVGCTSVDIQIRNLAATGCVHVHQVEMFTTLWDDPGCEVGTAPTDVGTPSTSAQSGDQEHSGAASWKVVTDADGEGIKRAITTTAGKFYHASAWVYVATAGKAVTMAGPTGQDGTAVSRATATVTAWERLECVFRATAASTDLQFTAPTGTTFYVDDVNVRLLDDVTLTATPASAANSAEGSGIRSDGLDTLTAPLSKLTATKGDVRFNYTPRHSAADVAKFGVATPIVAYLYGSATDYITLDWAAANTMRLTYNAGGAGAQTANWDATGAIVAGTTYAMRIAYTASGMTLYVDGTARITITAAVTFATVLTTFYGGSNATPANHSDIVSS